MKALYQSEAWRIYGSMKLSDIDPGRFQECLHYEMGQSDILCYKMDRYLCVKPGRIKEIEFLTLVS